MLLRAGDSATRSVARDLGATHHEPAFHPKTISRCAPVNSRANVMRLDAESPERPRAPPRTAQFTDGFEAPTQKPLFHSEARAHLDQVPRQRSCDCQRRFRRTS